MHFHIATPATMAAVLAEALDPALAYLPERMGSDHSLPSSAAVRVQCLATGEQESEYLVREQYGNGPARGFTQMEQGGGVKGVLTHPASRDQAAILCNIRQVVPTTGAVWSALADDDILAMGLTRLLYWTDPKPMPQLGDVEGAWQLYLRTWRPGAYDRGTPQKRADLRAHWGRAYQAAKVAVLESAA